MLTYSRAAMKCILFVFNLLFVVTGILLVGVGLAINEIYRKYQIFLDERFLSGPSLLITVGFILSLVAVFGCCGALQESHCMIMSYSVLLGVLYVMELWVGITGYKLSDDAIEVVSVKLNSSMAEYNHRPELTKLWDELQENLQCCGTVNSTEWHPFLNNSLPMSCCKPIIGAIGHASCNEDSTNLYRKPCLKALSILVRDNAVTLGSTGICIAFVQLLGVIFACNLGRSIGSFYQSI